MKTIPSLLLLLFSFQVQCQEPSQKLPKNFSVNVTNPLNATRENVLIYIPAENIDIAAQDFNKSNFAVFAGNKEIASQYNSGDPDFRGIILVLDKMSALENLSLQVRYSPSGQSKKQYTKRTQAELAHRTGGKFVNREYIGGDFKNVNFLRVPPEHKDHSWFIRYEGPGWESDKVGYRFYLDQRNATDVFGKKTTDLTLHKVGLDGFDSYHNMQPWGMDVMKVGKSLGIGSIGAIVADSAMRVEKTDSVFCRITENGDVFSSILTDYYGWKIDGNKYNLKSRISIHAGTTLTHQLLTIDPSVNLCTGIGKDNLAKILTSKGDKTHWAYMATYGKQSLNNDELGLAIFFDPLDVESFREDKYSHIVSLKTSHGNVEYYFAAAWVLQPDGIKDEKQFQEFLDKTSELLANPVNVNVVIPIARTGPLSVRMADSDIARNPKPSMLDFARGPQWNYTNGLVCSADQQVWKKTGDEKYYRYIKSYADEMIAADGTIKGYSAEEYNIDKVNSGKFLFEMLEKTGDVKYEKAIRTLRDQIRTHPRTSEGGLWHKKIYPNQMWLDGLYMASPFLTQYAQKFNEPSLLDDVAVQIELIDKHTYDPKTGLYYHGWDESKQQKWANKQTGTSPQFWGRAMGWFGMALVDVLDYFPKNHPKRKAILEITARLADGIVKYQDKKTNVWYQVVDKANHPGNYLEASASSMFAYFLLKGSSKGYIDKKYLATGLKAYNGVVEQFIKVRTDGMVDITNVCAVAGLGGNPYRDGTYDYYVNEKRRDNDPKAVGPFIMASLVYEALSPKKGKQQ
jgi:unsaturated rhamnogalacturonyl hydrolase